MLVDVRNELITPDYAADVYGVIIDGDAVDPLATEAQRAKLAGTQTFRQDYLRHFMQTVGIPAEHLAVVSESPP